jgi:ADP-ribosylglycohydrolase
VEHFRGCLLGGAVGDALGAPVEFLSLHEIRRQYGPNGIADYDVAYGRRGAITDDTQMTLFTAEGLLRTLTQGPSPEGASRLRAIHQAYLRWLHTQGESSRHPDFAHALAGSLFAIDTLHSRRAPGVTCLSALRGARAGTRRAPLNDSKGCGGVMRIAPVGLAAADMQQAFTLGCEVAALTHGHPSGYHAAGLFAAILCLLRDGAALPDSITRALALMDASGTGTPEECTQAVRRAVALWRDPAATPSPETIEQLGGGWVAEEAVAIALYCSLHAGNDFARGVLLAVNHSGDSDSTGALTGNLLGLLLGADAIPARWLHELELADVIDAIGRDLHRQFTQPDAPRNAPAGH